MRQHLDILFDFIGQHTNMSDLVTQIIAAVLIGSLGITGALILWMLKKLGTHLWEKLQVKRAAKQPQPQEPNPTPEYELRVVSYFECPKTGPYRMEEKPEIIQSFIKGQTMPPHYFGLFPRTVTWTYIPAKKLNGENNQ